MSDAFERAAQHAEDESRRQRRERTERRLRTGFRIHAAAFIAAQVALAVVWALTWQLGGTAHPWFLYPLVGWGIGLAAHYAAIRDSYRAAPR